MTQGTCKASSLHAPNNLIFERHEDFSDNATIMQGSQLLHIDVATFSDARAYAPGVDTTSPRPFCVSALPKNLALPHSWFPIMFCDRSRELTRGARTRVIASCLACFSKGLFLFGVFKVSVQHGACLQNG